MTIEQICAGASPLRNDDHVAVFHCSGVTDILVIDGGTSVAGHDYIDEVQGDVAWFVHAFTAALAPWLAAGRSQQDCVHAAIETVYGSFSRLAAGCAVPIHAWPIAALTWIRVGQMDGVTQATLYSLGDCKTLLRIAPGDCVDLDPFVNPQETVIQDAIAVLRAEGIIDPEQRRARMLPMLRARREFQNTAPRPGVLCLQPNGRFQARERSVVLGASARLLVMTDGFYRLVDTYGLYTDGTLMDACIEQGLAAQLDELRKFEAGDNGTGAQAVKAADDASAVLWTAVG